MKMALIQKSSRLRGKFQNPVLTSVGDASTFFKIMWLYFTSRAERMPTHPLGPFRTDPSIYANHSTTGLRVTWMGHSTSLVEIDGVRVLIDPVWDQRAAPVEWAGPKRFFPPALALESLPRIDVVLLSHDHYDHLGAGTVRRLASLKATREAVWVTTLGVGAILKKLGVQQPRDLDWTESLQVGSLQITALPARHFSGRSLFSRFETLWASFVLAGPQHRVYYGADSGEWPGYPQIAQSYGPFDLTMLEIGAFDPLWADIHMGPDGAARVFQQMGARGLLMPIHWGLFNLALHAWRQPIERIFAMENLRIWSPEPGLPTDVVSEVEVRSEWWRR